MLRFFFLGLVFEVSASSRSYSVSFSFGAPLSLSAAGVRHGCLSVGSWSSKESFNLGTLDFLKSYVLWLGFQF